MLLLHQNQIQFKAQNQDNTSQVHPEHQNHNGTDGAIQRIILADMGNIERKKHGAYDPGQHSKNRARQRIPQLHDTIGTQIAQNQDEQEHKADCDDKTAAAPQPLQLAGNLQMQILGNKLPDIPSQNPQHKGKYNGKNQTCCADFPGNTAAVSQPAAW